MVRHFFQTHSVVEEPTDSIAQFFDEGSVMTLDRVPKRFCHIIRAPGREPALALEADLRQFGMTLAFGDSILPL
jgi:hypothetical protein